MFLQFGSTRERCNQHGVQTVFRVVADAELLGLVLDAVHPGNFRTLPPSPQEIARKGVQIGLAGSASEFFYEVVVWRRQ